MQKDESIKSMFLHILFWNGILNSYRSFANKIPAFPGSHCVRLFACYYEKKANEHFMSKLFLCQSWRKLPADDVNKPLFDLSWSVVVHDFDELV